MAGDITPSRNAPRFRFGVFEVNPATGELRRQGLRVKLHAQPFQLLCFLLERPGQIVTRDEIAHRLWSDGTFVNFDHGVNSAINRIREALGDAASNPRFVETLARRGYRFIAPVERLASGVNLKQQSGNDAKPAEDLAGVLSESKNWILSSPADLPLVPGRVSFTLLALFQVMYLAFYVGALANLPEIEGLLAPLPHAAVAYGFVVLSAAILIPVRAFLLTGLAFRAPAFTAKVLRLWPFLLVFDVAWALAPFLLLHHIDFGLALACATLLVYAPFAQRSLVLMAMRRNSENPAHADPVG